MKNYLLLVLIFISFLHSQKLKYLDKSFSPGIAVKINFWRSVNFNTHNYLPNIYLDPLTLTLKSEVLASKPIGNNISPTNMVINDDILYFVGKGNTIRALNINTHKLIWKMKLTQEVIGMTYSYRDYLLVTLNSGVIMSINAKNGKKEWIAPIIYPIRSAPIEDNDKIFITDINNNIYAIDPIVGSILWKKSHIKKNDLSFFRVNLPAVYKNIVVQTTSDGNVIVYKNDNGALLWKKDLYNLSISNAMHDIKASPVIKNNKILVTTNNKRTYLFDANNGKLIWQQYISSLKTPIIANNRIVILDDDGFLRNLDLANGKELWKIHLTEYLSNADRTAEDLLWHNPLFMNGRIVVTTSLGNIIVVNPRTSYVVKVINLKDKIFNKPIVYKNKFIFLTLSGRLKILEGKYPK